MAVMGSVRRWAAAAPVPVFVAVGHGGDPVLACMRAADGIDVVASPRHATVLVVVGHIPSAAIAPLHRVHDQVPGPRAVVVVDGEPAEIGLAAATASTPPRLVDDLLELHSAVVAGQHSEPAVGASDNPVPWQGVGPHDQGGEGMMGGVPWGRPMAMPPVTGRDGLALDRLSLVLGPFLSGLPPVLEVEVGLQGDVLEEVTLRSIPSDVGAPTPTTTFDVDPNLIALAELLSLAGLDALATTAARLATAQTRRVEDVADLRRRIDQPWGLRMTTDGLGALELEGVARTATSRWQSWLESAVVASVGDERRAIRAVSLDDLADQLVGMEVGQALLTLATLRPVLAASTARPVAV